MTPSELDEYLAVARKHGCTRLRVGEVEADMLAAPPAPLEAASRPEPPEAPPKSPEEHWDRVERQLFEGAS